MLQEIQKFDYDRYLSIIFAPKDKREGLIALILFNLEIARVKSKVTEPMMGMIRFQWWREAIDEIYDPQRTIRRHDIVYGVRDLVKAYPQISKDDFLTMINAREKDLDNSPFKTLAEFNEYLFATSYPLNKMILDILEVRDGNIIAATKELSKAWAIAAILRSAYRNFASNRAVFPEDMMEKHNVIMAQFGRPEFVEKSKPLVKELCDMAEDHLAKAKEILRATSKDEKKKDASVLLNIRTARHHLDQIKNNDYDIFTKPLNPHISFINLIKIYLGNY